ncbi:MAG: MATE family efflux transporter [Clostridiales bacterium]|nr:MATE family efflux transporter [Clostridiales bacterium]
MRVENDLGRDSVGRLVWRIALPSMLAQFVSVLYSIIDRIYVGNIPEVGDVALAGVGVCGPIVTMVGSAAFLIGVGGAPMLSIRMGEGRIKEAERILSNCFLMLCVAAVVLTAVVIPLRRPMLYLFGASGVTYPYAEAYFTVYVSGTVFALLAVGMNQFVICQGFAKVGMKSVVLGAVLNIVLDPVFIFGFRMGVRGAALATVISQAASAVYVLRFLWGSRTSVHITFGGYQLRLMGKVLIMGFTPFLIIALDNVMIIVMNAVLQKYGGPSRGDALITCNTIVQSFMLVLTMPLGGISSGTQGILSYNYGARRADRVLGAQKQIAALCAGFTAIMFILAWTAGPLFVSLFTKSPELIRQSGRAIRICTLAAVPLGIQYAIVDGFTAMGQVQLALPLSFWRKTVYFVSVFALPALFGVDQVFFAETLSDLLGPLVSVTVYFFMIRKVLRRRTGEEAEKIAEKII